MIETILLDMDGVCCDFVGEACKAHGQDYESLKARWPAGEGWNFYELWGATEEEFWEPINNNHEFWRNLPEFEWTQGLIEIARSNAKEVRFATSPSSCPTSHYGKALWLQDRGFSPNKDAMIGSEKSRLAKRNVLLIDDNEPNCLNFSKEKGLAILFPQHWNSNHEYQNSKLDRIEILLKALNRDTPARDQEKD
jgi:5'(3')-deoxyribonucleotidase